MQKITFSITCRILAVLAVVMCLLTACKEEEPTPTETRLDEIFKIFDTFKAEEYTPPAGFDAKIDGATYGTITEKTYHSDTTKADRKCNVFTPPGYDPNVTYPVLYLLHGIGGTHKEWEVETNAEAGPPKAVEVLSNLINAGKAKPMIAVMPNVRAMKYDDVPSDLYGEANTQAFHNFINDLENDLMPFINRTYKVSIERDQIAIAGLSMGGMESLHIGCKMYETIGYVGSFSAPGLIPLSAAEQTVPDRYKDKTFFMLCSGTDDSALISTRNYNQNLTNNGIRTAYYDIPGGKHDFKVWNNGLYYFAQCIF